MSQRDRAILRVIECFAKSLKVTRMLEYGFLFAFYINYGPIL